MESARGDVKLLELSAVVIRADGTKEDLGVISRWSADEEQTDKEEPRDGA